MLAASAFAASWYRTEAARRAPNIPGYNWGKHPDTLLIAVPLSDHCSSCGLSISDLATEGLKHGLNVLVIAAQDSRELNTLRKSHPPTPSIITGVEPDIIKRFCPANKIGAVRIHNGRISARSSGGVPPPAFFQ